MYAKIYAQIFDSSLAENWQVRHVFEDLLKLAGCDGVVDMTHEAIARRTNTPLDVVRLGIAELEKPDPRSRSSEHEGRRIIRLDPHRDWGWLIINHGYYRTLRTQAEKREADRQRQSIHRNRKMLRKKSVTGVTDRDRALSPVSVSASLSVSDPPSIDQDTDCQKTVQPESVSKTGTADVIRLARLAHAAFPMTSPPIAPDQIVMANVRELFAYGRLSADLESLCAWCRTTKHTHRPKSPQSLTDPAKWEQWHTMRTEEQETTQHGKQDHSHRRNHRTYADRFPQDYSQARAVV